MAAALGLTLTAVVATPAGATPPGVNGRIAFKGYLDADRSTGAIYTIRPNGTSVRQITRPDAGIVDDQPDWSPDGTLVAFRRCAPDTPCAIYTVRANGSQLRRLSDGRRLRQVTHVSADTMLLSSSFSPDGTSIVYAQSGDNDEPDIFSARVDGSHVQQITHTPRWEGAPDWGPAK